MMKLIVSRAGDEKKMNKQAISEWSVTLVGLGQEVGTSCMGPFKGGEQGKSRGMKIDFLQTIELGWAKATKTEGLKWWRDKEDKLSDGLN